MFQGEEYLNFDLCVRLLGALGQRLGYVTAREGEWPLQAVT